MSDAFRAAASVELKLWLWEHRPFEGDGAFACVDVLLFPDYGRISSKLVTGMQGASKRDELHASVWRYGSGERTPLMVANILTNGRGPDCLADMGKPGAPFSYQLENNGCALVVRDLFGRPPPGAAATNCGVELVLCPVIRKMRKAPKFLFYSGHLLPSGALEEGLRLLESRDLALVLDLDHTLVHSTPLGRAWLDRFSARPSGKDGDDEARAAKHRSALQDHVHLNEYVAGDRCIVDTANGKKAIHAKSEEVIPENPSAAPFNRPVVRLTDAQGELRAVLTRLDPADRNKSMLLRLRPGWQEFLRRLNAVRDQGGSTDGQRATGGFDLYVNTMGLREYALEVWRVLDPDGQWIPHRLRPVHIVAATKHQQVPPGASKGLPQSLHMGMWRYRLEQYKQGGHDAASEHWDGAEFMPNTPTTASPLKFDAFGSGHSEFPLAVIVDDTVGVWDQHSKHQVVRAEKFEQQEGPEELLRLAELLGILRSTYYRKLDRLCAEDWHDSEKIARGLTLPPLGAADPDDNTREGPASLVLRIAQKLTPRVPKIHDLIAWNRKLREEDEDADRERERDGKQRSKTKNSEAGLERLCPKLEDRAAPDEARQGAWARPGGTGSDVPLPRVSPRTRDPRARLLPGYRARPQPEVEDARADSRRRGNEDGDHGGGRHRESRWGVAARDERRAEADEFRHSDRGRDAGRDERRRSRDASRDRHERGRDARHRSPARHGDGRDRRDAYDHRERHDSRHRTERSDRDRHRSRSNDYERVPRRVVMARSETPPPPHESEDDRSNDGYAAGAGRGRGRGSPGRARIVRGGRSPLRGGRSPGRGRGQRGGSGRSTPSKARGGSRDLAANH
ncbi:unnamed protein product [Pedinophyceae sp. YPF-701]|nr:unnamed protein product [Pedinophyceae sp. YPF-701]